MNCDHISPFISFSLENGEKVVFKRFLRLGEKKPTIAECNGKIVGISLGYAFCGEQDFGIGDLAKAFDALNDEMIIKKVPLETIVTEKVSAIKYGERVDVNAVLIRETTQIGVVGYWDSENIIICASKEYRPIIDSIKDFIRPNNVKFSFEPIFGGRGNLAIISAK